MNCKALPKAGPQVPHIVSVGSNGDGGVWLASQHRAVLRQIWLQRPRICNHELQSAAQAGPRVVSVGSNGDGGVWLASQHRAVLQQLDRAAIRGAVLLHSDGEVLPL